MDTGLVRRYATALYDIAVKRNVLERVAADVETMDSGFRENPRLLEVLTSPQVPDDRKKAIFTHLFGSRVDPLTLRFCHLLVDRGRVAVFEGLQGEFQRLSDAAGGIVRARVQTAVPLTPDQEERLIQQLSQLTGKKVIARASVDESLRGGVVVWIGDRVIDGSIKGYLSALEARLS